MRVSFSIVAYIRNFINWSSVYDLGLKKKIIDLIKLIHPPPLIIISNRNSQGYHL